MSEADNGGRNACWSTVDSRWEAVVRTPTRTIVTACALSAALCAGGCVGDGDEGTTSSGEIFLQPAAARGPDPFTDSTATSTVTPSPVARTPRPAHSGQAEPQTLSGETPGLYGGTRGTGSCDVGRQIDRLTADRGRARGFAQAAGVSRASIPGYLRGLTSVVLRADTRVTNHGYRDGRTTGYQSVLQAGTAVLVDDHGVPRVRCACGNPLAPPVAARGEPGTSGRAWSGYRPSQVVVVTPAPRVINDITIIDVDVNTWIERPIGHRGHGHDQVVPPSKPLPPTSEPLPPTSTPMPPTSKPVPPTRVPDPPHDSASGTRPGDDGTQESASPSGESTSPEQSPSGCVTPTVTVTPGVTPGATGDAEATSDPRPTACPTATVTASPAEPTASGSGTEPQSIPDSPDSPNAVDSVFGSPTDVFDS
ncbi:DUF6777 domain-containing protein [Streptomyces sp. NPDC059010]|uniref:DUF6777 domain-containing protein n=1 Tax=Streptomyces sp. NPDC059010 TaxID=3346695 RepID=UPI0036B8B7C0